MKNTTQTPAQHTPTPWHIECAEIMSEGNRTIICDPWAGRANRIEGDRVCLLPIDVREANAAFIVRACNAHAGLVEALVRFVGIRKPNSGKWTKAETERSLAALESEARAILATLEA